MQKIIKKIRQEVGATDFLLKNLDGLKRLRTSSLSYFSLHTFLHISVCFFGRFELGFTFFCHIKIFTKKIDNSTHHTEEEKKTLFIELKFWRPSV